MWPLRPLHSTLTIYKFAKKLIDYKFAKKLIDYKFAKKLIESNAVLKSEIKGTSWVT